MTMATKEFMEIPRRRSYRFDSGAAPSEGFMIRRVYEAEVGGGRNVI